MSAFWMEWMILVGVFSMALVSPGPDFVMAIRNSFRGSLAAGVLTAAGFALGVAVHMTYTLAGLAVLIAQSIVLFSILKYAGAAYLIYIGYKSLRSRGFAVSADQEAQRALTGWQAFSSGFLTNLLNPKATLFFLAVFTQFVGPQTPFVHQLAFASTCVVMTFLWFSLVAVFLATPAVRAVFLKASRWIDRVCGAALIALGLRLALTKMGATS